MPETDEQWWTVQCYIQVDVCSHSSVNNVFAIQIQVFIVFINAYEPSNKTESNFFQY